MVSLARQHENCWEKKEQKKDGGAWGRETGPMELIVGCQMTGNVWFTIFLPRPPSWFFGVMCVSGAHWSSANVCNIGFLCPLSSEWSMCTGIE